MLNKVAVIEFDEKETCNCNRMDSDFISSQTKNMEIYKVELWKMNSLMFGAVYLFGISCGY